MEMDSFQDNRHRLIAPQSEVLVRCLAHTSLPSIPVYIWVCRASSEVLGLFAIVNNFLFLQLFFP